MGREGKACCAKKEGLVCEKQRKPLPLRGTASRAPCGNKNNGVVVQSEGRCSFEAKAQDTTCVQKRQEAMRLIVTEFAELLSLTLEKSEVLGALFRRFWEFCLLVARDLGLPF